MSATEISISHKTSQCFLLPSCMLNQLSGGAEFLLVVPCCPGAGTDGVCATLAGHTVRDK